MANDYSAQPQARSVPVDGETTSCSGNRDHRVSPPAARSQVRGIVKRSKSSEGPADQIRDNDPTALPELPTGPPEIATEFPKFHRLQTLDPAFANQSDPRVATGSGLSPSGPADTTVTLPQLEDYQEEFSFWRSLRLGFRIWGTSFLLHVGLLFLLAWVTFGISQSDNIFLVGEDVERTDIDTMDMSVQLDLSAVATEPLENSQVLESIDFSQIDPDSESFNELVEPDFTDGLLASSSLMDTIAGVGSSIEDAGQAATFYGIQAKGKNFVFVVDRSGSMGGVPWEEARAELLRAVNSLTPDQTFFVILFNHQSQPMLELKGRKAKLKKPTESNLNQFFGWLDRQFPGGGTMPKDSMKLALRLKPDAIFLLSDGILRDDTYQYLQRRNKPNFRSTGRQQIVIHTIAFKDFAGATLLQQIALENGGVFKFVQ